MMKYLTIFCLAMSNLFAINVNINGYAFLDDQSDHSLINIKFTAVSPSANNDSTITNSSGQYSLILEAGIYNLQYYKENYLPHYVNNLYLVEDTTLPSITLQYGTILDISDTISGILTSDYIYRVTGNLIVPHDSSLTINPGVKVMFFGDYNLNCYGPITAIGNEQDSIYFTSALFPQSAGDWGGINIYYNDYDSTNIANQFDYCVFSYGRGNTGQLEISSSLVSINHSSFRTSSRGDLYLSYSYGIVNNSNFSGGSSNYWNINNNRSEVYYRDILLTDFDDAFYISNSSEVELKTSSFLNGNRRALYTDGWATATVDSCTFNNIQNDWTVQFHDNSLITFTNNLLENVQSWNVLGVWSNAHVDIVNNYFEGLVGYYNYNSNSQNQADPPQISYNVIVRNPQDCCYDGLQLHNNNRLVEAHHNTIYGFTNGHQGIHLHYNDSLSIHSNIVYGNSNALYSYNNGYLDLSYNSFYANNILMQEDDFPQGFGQRTTTNTNGDPSDIYANIFMDPELENIGNNNYDLRVTSPAINAGSPNDLDDDGTISDIGANPYFFPFIINDAPLSTTNDTIGPYVVTAEVIPTQDQTINTSLYYKSNLYDFASLPQENKSLYFDGNGTQGRVVIPYNPILGNFNSITIETWVKPMTANYGYTIFSNRGSNGSESILLYYNAWDKRIRWHIDTGYGFQNFDGNTRLEPGQWYHVAVVYNGNQSILYVNGNYDGSMAVSGTIYDTNGDPYIGFRRDHGSDWNGFIDDFRIWNVARSQGEIQNNMYHELFGTESNLIGYWNFNEGSGAIVLDLTANHNHGSIIDAYYSENAPNLLPAEGFVESDWTEVTMINTVGDSYNTEIPGQTLGTTVDYFIQVTDNVDTLTSPYNVPYEFHHFNVSMFESYVTFDAVQQNDGSIALTWGTPIPVDGTLTGYKIYFSPTSTPSISTDYLLATLSNNENSFTHQDLTEGTTYYYTLTGLLNDGTETIIAPEINAVSNSSNLLVVQGMVNIENETNHSNVKVLFIPETSTGIRDSVFTDSTGYFNIILPISIYTVEFSKEGCVPQQLSSLLLTDNYDFGTIQLIAREVQELTGSVSGTLFSNYYYIVKGNLSISNNDTLWIEPGAIIAFDGYYRIVAQGPIFAMGTEEDSILFTSHSSQPGPGDWEYIQLQNNAEGSRFNYTIFENGDGWSEWVGSGVVRVDHVSDVSFDHCRFSYNQRGALVLYGNRSNYSVQNSTFSHNYQDQNNDGGILNIRLWSSGGNVLISDNVFYQNYGNDIASYECRYLTINNNFFFSDNNYDNQAIYLRQIKPLIVTNNTLTGKCYIGVHHDCFGIISRNSIKHNTNYTHGIYINQSSLIIEKNVIINCNKGIIYQNNSSFSDNMSYSHTIRNNTINGTYDGSILIRDNSRDIDIYNNTIVNADLDNNNGSDAAGIRLNNNSGDIFLHSNVIIDSRYAMTLNNTGNINIYNNDFWNNDNIYAGSGYPSGLGIINNQNINGDPSDIYSNIYLDPQFIEPDSNNFSLSNSSPLIDAGYILYTDPDGTILDIGANYFDHGNPRHLAIMDVDDQELTLQWSAVNRDSLNNYNVYMKLSNESDYTLNLSTVDTIATVLGLTNNLDYNFVVTSVYPHSESIYSIAITGRPGLAEISFLPDYLIQSTPSEDTAHVSFQIQNNGVKDLSYLLEVDSLHDSFTGYYYNNSDWDNFSELLALRLDDYINFNWDDNSQLPQGVPNDNFHVRWTGFVNFPTSGDYYFEYCIDDNMRIFIDGNQIFSSEGCCWCGHNQYIEQGHHEVIIDYIEYGGSAYTYLKWQPPGENLDWFRSNGLLGPEMFSNLSGVVAPSASTDINVSIPPGNSGAYTVSIPYSTNDKSDPFIKLPLLLMRDYPFIPAVKFFPSEETGDPFYLVINDGTIDDNNLQPGDEVAILDGDSCVGAGMYSGEFPLVIRSYGFVEGNAYTLQVWDNSQYRYGTTESIHVSTGNGLLIANTFNVISLNATVYSRNYIEIIPDQFNLISLNMYPQNSEAGSVFGGIDGLKIVYDDHGGAFIPDYNINTIGSVNLSEGYYLFFDSTNGELYYPGLSVDNTIWPLIINANRWNYISYLPETPADTSIFSSIRDSIDIMINDEGGSWIPSLDINTIGNFQPGEGYKVFLSTNTDISFTYPTSTGSLSKIFVDFANIQKHFKFIQTGQPYTIIIQSADFEGRMLQTGDEIGIFDDRLCVGAGSYNGHFPMVLTAWAGNTDLELPGFIKNDQINLKFFSKKYNMAYPLSNEFNSEIESRFSGANYSIIKHSSTGGDLLPNSYALGNNYPNPFNPTTIIPYQLPEDTKVRITIYNMLGQEIVILLDEIQLSNFHKVIWEGKDNRGRSVPSGVYIYRLETPNFQKSKKLLLLK